MATIAKMNAARVHLCATVLVVTIIVMQFNAREVDGCTCLSPVEPNYCTTDFFGLLRIVEETKPSGDLSPTRYTYQTLSTIRDPLHVLRNPRYQTLYTARHSSSCGVELRVGERYLIGGRLHQAKDRLTLDLCTSHVEHYPSAPEGPMVGTKEFESLLENCGQRKPVKPQNTPQPESSQNRIHPGDESEAPLNLRPSVEGPFVNDELEREGPPLVAGSLDQAKRDYLMRRLAAKQKNKDL